MTVMKIGDITQIKSGYAFQSKRFNGEGKGMPLIRIRDVGKNNPITYYEGDYSEEYVVKKGDFLISMDGEFKIAQWKGQTALLNQRVCKIAANEHFIDSKYMYYFLPRELQKIEDTTSFVTVKHLSVKQIKDIEMSLPPIEEQKKIALILSKAQTLIEKRKEAIAKLDELVQSVFSSMFGDPIKNEKGWEQVSLNNIGETIGGLQVTSKRSIHPIEVPYLRVANVFRDFLNLSEIKFMQVTQREFDRTKLVAGDILIVEGHGNQNEIGRSAVWDDSIQGCVHQNHLIKFRANRKWVNPVFVSAFLNSPSGRRQLLKYSNTTSGLNTISTTTVKKLIVYLPPLELQNKFEFIIGRIKEEKKQMEQSLSELQINLQSLLQHAFKGELDINKKLTV
ncbi:restriction endonuclease subunit S [Bacillus toyonensis]|uniref:Restriction endonuclease subunit S n=1 Tax=Bacillus toyonensis TaxID=155322 RepID=A0AB73QW47_9BACI|nr:restriction endonuclease subunit S [Bacillus toyonensis]PEI85567.1 restriction endonuclease subunit S [Bacillus toyonensis]